MGAHYLFLQCATRGEEAREFVSGNHLLLAATPRCREELKGPVEMLEDFAPFSHWDDLNQHLSQGLAGVWDHFLISEINGEYLKIATFLNWVKIKQPSAITCFANAEGRNFLQKLKPDLPSSVTLDFR